MIKEAYCSYEVSKLLKEKGFPQDYDIYHSMIYNEKDYEDEYEVQRMVTETQFIKAGTLSSYPVGVPEPKCYAPTHQMAMAWLREEKNVLIYVYPVINLPVKDNSTFHWRWDGKKKIHCAPHIGEKHNYETFEDAVEAALKYCLQNLI